MKTQQLEKYQKAILKSNYNSNSKELPNELLMDKLGELEVYYAPFDHINKNARVVICGITPGFQQADIAIRELKSLLVAKNSVEKALEKVKGKASFAGVMRTNLVKMLDFVGLHRKLNLESTSELFSTASGMVHYTSALRYPVFKSGSNYSGTPSMVKNTLLCKQIDNFLAEEVKALSCKTIYIPLGPKVSEALRYLCSKGFLKEEQILSGLPHPSGANAERIAFFLEQKSEDKLSKKTNPKIILSARKEIMKKVRSLK